MPAELMSIQISRSSRVITGHLACLLRCLPREKTVQSNVNSSPDSEKLMSTVASPFPEQGQWSEADYLALDGNRLVELSDGRLEELPVPTIFHQLLVDYLHAALKLYLASHPTGKAFFAPLPVRLWSGKFREPDVIYLTWARLGDVHGQPQGADLVMEVVSEGEENRERDLETKRREYAAAGITEYWIIDPLEQHIVVLTLAGTAYREHGVFGRGTEATSALLPGFTVNVAAVFAAGQGA
jgi:Uma2 family endonuclease